MLAPKVRRRKEIIDRRKLVVELEALVGEANARNVILARLKEALEAGEAEIESRFLDRKMTGVEAVAGRSYMIDQLVRIIHDIADQHVYSAGSRTTSDLLTIIAVGGYGRNRLAPQSDVDLLFLRAYKDAPRVEQIVEYILYMLWDMGLKVGQATRTIVECMRYATDDLTIRTSLLDARWLWGDQELYHELRDRFQTEIVLKTRSEFVAAKLKERDDRHDRLGDSRYVLEPNIKDGKGGLRDLQTLRWIGRYIYNTEDVRELQDCDVIDATAARKFDKATDFLWTVRMHLHMIAGRPEERLTFDVQPEIAARMGYKDHAGAAAVERFMKHYYLIAKNVGDLTRMICAVLEERHKPKRRLHRRVIDKFRRQSQEIAGFRLNGDRLTVEDDATLREEPVNIIRFFNIAEKHGLDIHPDALQAINENLKLVNGKLRSNEEASRLFMEILTSPRDPEQALRWMNECGVFGRFLPDFGRVVAQMQYDTYHVYTVDEHTIRAIGMLHRIERGELKDEVPIASEVIGKIDSRQALYLAVLLHDIAKGRGGDHSELGADLALKIAPRMGLSPAETETVAWLVRHHLLMSATAFKRDIDDPKTVEDFMTVVQSPERLKLLLILTVVDIRAVGPNIWNNWKAVLLRRLYYACDDMLSGGLTIENRDTRVERAQQAVREHLSEWNDADWDALVDKSYPAYWLAFPPDAIIRHARLIRDADRDAVPLTITHRHDSYRGSTELTVYAADHPGLFSRIAGAIALKDANIVDARIVTMANGMALDSFWIQDDDDRMFDNPKRLAQLTVAIDEAIAGEGKVVAELAKPPVIKSRRDVFKVPTRVMIDNSASNSRTVIEVNGRDRPGLLYDITSAVTDLGLSINSAHITTYGERVVDVFYVKDVFGLKVESAAKLKKIRERLTKAVDNGKTRDRSKPAAKPTGTTRPKRRKTPAAAAE